MNDSMSGFYRAKYDSPYHPTPSTICDGENYYMLATHFEPCDARRAFPCFDEPHLKASFQLEVELPEGQEVLSNMSTASVSPGQKDGLKKVVFESTPVMSTYVGDPDPRHEFRGSNSNSSQPGRSETSSTSKNIRTRSTMADGYRFVYTLLQVRHSTGSSRLNKPVRYLTFLPKRLT